MTRVMIAAAILFAGCTTAVPLKEEPYVAHLYGEGIIYDSLTSTFYVSSARTGTIGKVNRAGEYSIFYTDSGFCSTYGLRIDPERELLYACAGDANYSENTSAKTRRKMNRLIGIDLKSREKVQDYDLSPLNTGDHYPKDLCFDSTGNIYITDSYSNIIYKVSAEGHATVFSRSSLFKTNGNGLSGIAYHPSGFLLADNATTGELYKIDMSNPANVRKVILPQRLEGADGLLLNNGILTVVLNGQKNTICRLTSDDNWRSATIISTAAIDDRDNYPSIATNNGENIWLVNTRYNDIKDSTYLPAYFALQQVTVGQPIGKQ